MLPIADDHISTQKIRAFVSDVDGVFTNGWIGYGNGSSDETKFFYAKDGIGIQLLRQAGIITGIITGRRCKANIQRLQGDLGIQYIVDGCRCKQRGMEEFCRMAGVTPEECLYVGDDLNDYQPLRMAGIAAAPCDSEPEILEIAQWVSIRPGGRGAIRDLVNRLLKGKGLWEKATENFTTLLKDEA